MLHNNSIIIHTLYKISNFIFSTIMSKKYIYVWLLLIIMFITWWFWVYANWPLSHVEYSTFVWGTWNEHNGGMYKGWMVADADGNIYILGMTNSDNFPTTPWVIQSAYGWSSYDCVVSKFDSTLTTLMAATYLWGTWDDRCADIEIWPKWSIYISMNTTSSDLTLTTNAYDSTRQGRETYIARVSPDLTQILESTYFGWWQVYRIKQQDLDRMIFLWLIWMLLWRLCTIVHIYDELV